MPSDPYTAGTVAGRLRAEEIAENFTDLHPPLDDHEALVAADRCYFCHDAPCMEACPTSIDVPLFIRQIATGTAEAAARTIFDQNILGGMCARVCPTETLCEEACVRMTAEEVPVEIGRLQRYATDRLTAAGTHPFARAEATGKRIAVVGAGPAGLACAHRLAMKGHGVTIYEARAKGGGLNEYGIAAYKATNGFAEAELTWLLGIGGIEIRYGEGLGGDRTVAQLQNEYDAVFLGLGLAAVNRLQGWDKAVSAVDWIAELRQSADKTDIAVGRNVVVIGGGMTAVDAAVQARLLGAETVTIAYRRARDHMAASRYEQDLAAASGVRILTEATPAAMEDGEVAFVHPTNAERIVVPADQVMLAIGQKLSGPLDGIALDGGKIAVDAAGRASVPGVWAGGDCASGGDDLTVTAVAEGRDAAEDIHQSLMG